MMQINNPEDLKAIQLACNSAWQHHHALKVEAAQAMYEFYPERELVRTFEFHQKMQDRFFKLAQAAKQQIELLEVHEKAAS